MKKSVLLMALMAVTLTAGAQRNDLYSTGKSNSRSSSQSTTQSQSAVITRTPSYTEPSKVESAPVQQAAPVVKTTPQIIVDRDPDEYNRRYTYGTSQIQYEDGSILDDVPTVYIHDTIYVKDATEDKYIYIGNNSYAEGYNDAVEDYYLTRRLYRFRHNGRPYFTLIDDILFDIVYWDRYFDDRYWTYSHTYYYDPCFYDPWYYDSWYYDPWYYDRYYYYGPGYHHPHPAPAYYAGRGPESKNERRVNNFTPNRSINGGGWDRDLSRATSDRMAASSSSSERSINRSGSSSSASRSVSRAGSESSSERSIARNSSRNEPQSAGSSSSSSVRSVAPATSSRSNSPSRDVNSSSSSRTANSSASRASRKGRRCLLGWHRTGR